MPVPWDWHYFPRTDPAIPPSVTEPLIARAGLPGTLCNAHSSGMPVIRDFGVEHIRDRQADPLHLRRQRAADRRPRDAFRPRAPLRGLPHRRRDRPPAARRPRHRPALRRRDGRRPSPAPPTARTSPSRRPSRPSSTGWSRPAAAPTPSARSATSSPTAASRRSPRARTTWRSSTPPSPPSTRAGDGDLVFANYVDFDTLWGHARDVSGYARALEAFDARLPEVLARLRPGDLLDPHRRPRQRPDLSAAPTTPASACRCSPPAPASPPRAAGLVGFADVGETIAAHLGLAPGRHGRSFL